MDDRVFDARELIVSVVLLVGLSRLLEGPLLWAVAGLLLATAALGSLQLLARVDPAGESSGIPIESVLVPAATAVAALGAIRLVPIGLWLVPGLALVGLLLRRALAVEAGLLAPARSPAPTDRTAVMAGILGVAFIGFLGVAATVPGGLPGPGVGSLDGHSLPLQDLATLAAGDALIAGLLGYRAAALRGSQLREVLWSALTCALAVAISAAAFRAMALPRLLGPALLVIVFYLWDAIQGSVRTERRDPRRIWEAILLVLAGLIVIAWSLNVEA